MGDGFRRSLKSLSGPHTQVNTHSHSYLGITLTTNDISGTDTCSGNGTFEAGRVKNAVIISDSVIAGVESKKEKGCAQFCAISHDL